LENFQLQDGQAKIVDAGIFNLIGYIPNSLGGFPRETVWEQ
jgi:hypothetical protein